MRHPSEIDDLHLEHSTPDHSWAHGELELSDERPTTTLSSDPGHRKWMLIGVGGCGVVTAIAVLLLTRDPGQPQAAQQQPEVEQAASELAVEPAASEPASDPTAAGPATELAAPINAAVKPTTLAATSRAATVERSTTRSAPAPKKAPPIPASTPSKPAATPSKPAPTPSAPAPAQPKVPSLPSADQISSEPESDLPDVEGWDEADAAVERDEPAADPVLSEPPSVTPDVVDEANSAI